MKISDKLRKAIERRIGSIGGNQNMKARIGVLENEHYESGESVAYVAAIHEYGSPSNGIPPRPFFRPTVTRNKKKWAATAGMAIKSGASFENALDMVGLQASADVKQTLSEITEPPLKESTIRARKRKYKSKSNKVSTKPLIDTRLLFDSISHSVEGE